MAHDEIKDQYDEVQAEGLYEEGMARMALYHRHCQDPVIVAPLLAVCSRVSPRPRRPARPDASVRRRFALVEKLREDADLAMVVCTPFPHLIALSARSRTGDDGIATHFCHASKS